MNWKTTYPILADVKTASLSTLLEWEAHLPEPRTDVERTIYKRIVAKAIAGTGKEIRQTDPELADSWNEVMDSLQRMGINTPGKM
jgi:hypothetical protein